MRRHVAAVTAIWLAGAVVAASGVTAALSFLGTGLFGAAGRPMTEANVQQDLAQLGPAATPSSQPSSAAASPRPRHAPSPAAGPTAAAPQAFATTGGTVFASCLSGKAKITWFAAQGYETEGSQGPATSTWVTFKSGQTGQRVTVTCSGGHPHFTSVADDSGVVGTGGDDGGGGHGGGGGPGGGGGRGGGGHDG